MNTSKKILIVDDDPDVLFILTTILQKAGYKVEPLLEGSSLVNHRENWPDLFILDKELPTIDGLALCKYLKVRRDTKNIPIVMISAHHEVKKKARTIGVCEFVEKPFNLKHLLGILEKHCAHIPGHGEG